MNIFEYNDLVLKIKKLELKRNRLELGLELEGRRVDGVLARRMKPSMEYSYSG